MRFNKTPSRSASIRMAEWTLNFCLALDAHGDAHAAADTECGETLLGVAATIS